MKTVSIINLFFFLLISPHDCLFAQKPLPDENLGMGIVELSMDKEESAKEYFRKSWSINAKAILERIESHKGSHRFQFDYSDPTLIGFYDYIVYISQKAQYSFFSEIVRELDARNPNKELGKLGLFYNAYFSPKSTFLTIHGSDKTIVLESKSGKSIEVIDHNTEVTDAHIIFSKDEKFVLKYLEIGIGEKATKIITYEDFKNKKVIWRKEMMNHVDVSFSKDYSKVIIHNSDFSDYDIYEIDTKSGKEISKKHITNVNHDSMCDLFKKSTAVQVDYFPDDYLDDYVRIESPNKNYLLVGNRTYGNFTLKMAKGNKLIREFRFASGIE